MTPIAKKMNYIPFVDASSIEITKNVHYSLINFVEQFGLLLLGTTGAAEGNAGRRSQQKN